MHQWLLELQLVHNKYSHLKYLDREVIFSEGDPPGLQGGRKLRETDESETRRVASCAGAADVFLKVSHLILGRSLFFQDFPVTRLTGIFLYEMWLIYMWKALFDPENFHPISYKY